MQLKEHTSKPKFAMRFSDADNFPKHMSRNDMDLNKETCISAQMCTEVDNILSAQLPHPLEEVPTPYFLFLQ